jgi:hypothetical protein
MLYVQIGNWRGVAVKPQFFSQPELDTTEIEELLELLR